MAARSLPLLLLAGAALGCAGPSFDGGIYRGRDVAFRFEAIPQDWRRIEIDAADLAFRDEPHEASILVNSRCSREDQDAPLAALTAHLVMGTTDRQVSREETIPFDGREALHTVMVARLDGVPMTYDIYVLKKDGCVYDLIYVSDPAKGAPGMSPFDAFARGFHTLDAGAPKKASS